MRLSPGLLFVLCPRPLVRRAAAMCCCHIVSHARRHSSPGVLRGLLCACAGLPQAVDGYWQRVSQAAVATTFVWEAGRGTRTDVPQRLLGLITGRLRGSIFGYLSNVCMLRGRKVMTSCRYVASFKAIVAPSGDCHVKRRWLRCLDVTQ
jgi:hypothetical protein